MDATNSSSGAGTSNGGSLTLTYVFTYVFLALVTFGIGAALELKQLKDVWRRCKVAFCTGLLAQYLIMPAAARVVSKNMFNAPDLDAFGLILIGCCPGGAVSNSFAYFARADMALSLSMTATSNALAFGTMPLLLFVWTQGLNLPFESTNLPWVDILSSLAMVLGPAALGIQLRRKSTKWALRAERLGAVGGLLGFPQDRGELRRLGRCRRGPGNDSGTSEYLKKLPYMFLRFQRHRIVKIL